MSWNKWLQQFGIGGGTAVLSAGGLIISCILVALIQLAAGKGPQLEGFFIALAVSIFIIAPLAYLIMELLFSLDEADIDIIRKEAQVEYLKKFVSHQGNSVEKDQLIQDLNSFAQTVAHDLKNPLTTILGFATMLADHQANIPPDQQKDALQTIVRTSLKMNNIIQELLLLAAVRQSEMRTGPIQMASIVSSTKQRMWGMLSESKAELVVPDQNSWPKVVGYAPWIEEVWINYVSNAIKYGGTPARIELGSDANYNKSPSGRNMARFWVKDNGRGIDHKDQSELFTQFTRLDQVRAEGHGLGLSIVARVIEKLGGQVGVESEPGQGSLFYFTLPMVVVEPPTRVPAKIALKRS